MKKGAALEQRGRLFTGVDEVRIFVARRRRGAHPEDAVLAVKNDLAVLREMVGHERRQSDAKIDVGALWNVARDARRHLIAAPSIHWQAVSLEVDTTR